MPFQPLIAPSVLASDFSALGKEVEMLNESQADWIHIDVMDGVFVPNISFGLPVCEAIARHARKPLDVHLMIVQPEKYIQAFQKAGATSISVHIEASPHLHRTLSHIKECGCSAGIAVNPHTPISALESIVEYADYICLMSVNPGFGGQKFIESTYGKVEQLRSLIQDRKANPSIQIDGGVDLGNAQKLVDAGADILVAGSSVFKAENPKTAIEKLKVERKKGP